MTANMASVWDTGAATDNADTDIAAVDQPRLAVWIVLAAAAGESGHAEIKAAHDLAGNYQSVVDQIVARLLSVVAVDRLTSAEPATGVRERTFRDRRFGPILLKKAFVASMLIF
ncbi:hypothetical protein [Bradyrhizobium sp. UFLA05-112]